MVEMIEFKDKRFDTYDNNNVLELTENTIILCNNLKLMDSLATEIINTINGKAEYNDYCCEDEDCGAAKMELNFGLQKVIDVNGQKITLCLEPAMIYKEKDIKDIWFCDYCGSNETESLKPYKESIYPLFCFKGSKQAWSDGLDRIYRNICNGRYGCFDGKWVSFHKSYN